MLKMIDAEKALELVLDNVSALDEIEIPLSQALGYTLAEPIHSDRDYPPFNRAMMDGFAVRLKDAGQRVPVEGLVAAGEVSKQTVRDGSCLEIMTGASCPEGTEAVVQYELTDRDNGNVQLPTDIKPRMNIAGKGAECASGDLVLDTHDEITPLATAVLATFGKENIKVVRRPSITVITTGDEILDSHEEMASGKIRNSNGPMLVALARQSGLSDINSYNVGDTEDELRKQLIEAEQSDIIVLSGGVSMGKFDIVPKILADLGVELIFNRVKQKPGKPLLFGKKGSRLYFGLPGNPLACHMCFHRYLSPVICKIQAKPCISVSRPGILQEDIMVKGSRLMFQLVRIEESGGSGVKIFPLKGRGSADIFAPAHANGYISLVPGKEYSAGTSIEFEYTGVRRWRNSHI